MTGECNATTGQAIITDTTPPFGWRCQLTGDHAEHVYEGADASLHWTTDPNRPQWRSFTSMRLAPIARRHG